MIIHKLITENFKSLYGRNEFDFNTLGGMVKLSGPVGSGKTALGEAILYALYGEVPGQTIPSTISWNANSQYIYISLSSKGKNLEITRELGKPLKVLIDGVALAGDNKRNLQSMLDDELYDIPKLAMVRMCIISFNNFNSLCVMTPYQTRQFLDDVFGLNVMSKYAAGVAEEIKQVKNEQIKQRAIYDANNEQIIQLREKSKSAIKDMSQSYDIKSIENQKSELINEGRTKTLEKKSIEHEYNMVQREFGERILEENNKLRDWAGQGKQLKKQYKMLQAGKCPTCGHNIDKKQLDELNDEIQELAKKYRAKEAEIKTIQEEEQNKCSIYIDKINTVTKEIEKLRNEVTSINEQIAIYNTNIQEMEANYADVIMGLENDNITIKDKLDALDIEYTEWEQLQEMMTKTLRYKLIDMLVPSINNTIQKYVNKMSLPYRIEFDADFKAHIFTDMYDGEISYKNLSTGQKKSLDLAVIFGILHNMISSMSCNIIFLDELFSNMDVDMRDTMLKLLKESFGEDKSIFIINHAEMRDDWFDHKIRAKLENARVCPDGRSKAEVPVTSTKYEFVF